MFPRTSLRNVSAGAPSFISAATDEVEVEEEHERVRSSALNSAAGPRRRFRQKTQQSGLLPHGESEAGMTDNVPDAEEAVTETKAYKAEFRAHPDAEVCKGCFQIKSSAQMLKLRHSKKETRRCMGTLCRTCASVSCGLFRDEDGKEQLSRITTWRCDECNVEACKRNVVACKRCTPRVEGPQGTITCFI